MFIAYQAVELLFNMISESLNAIGSCISNYDLEGIMGKRATIHATRMVPDSIPVRN